MDLNSKLGMISSVAGSVSVPSPSLGHYNPGVENDTGRRARELFEEMGLLFVNTVGGGHLLQWHQLCLLAH
eukprot:6926802-Lingulodinium_polyedra.AAC.1